jgi:hypothetical protein
MIAIDKVALATNGPQNLTVFETCQVIKFEEDKDKWTGQKMVKEKAEEDKENVLIYISKIIREFSGLDFVSGKIIV